METVSVIQVRSMDCMENSSKSFCCPGVGSSKTRTLRSAAINVRASFNSIPRKAREKPRTPVSDPTPTATARITKANLAAEWRESRQASRSAVLALIADNDSIAHLNTAIGPGGELGIVRDQHQRGA